jgi:hypothetical protein
MNIEQDKKAGEILADLARYAEEHPDMEGTMHRHTANARKVQISVHPLKHISNNHLYRVLDNNGETIEYAQGHEDDIRLIYGDDITITKIKPVRILPATAQRYAQLNKEIDRLEQQIGFIQKELDSIAPTRLDSTSD